MAGINSTTNRNYIHDNVDVSEAINFFAAMIVTSSIDCCHKNFYLYRDSEGDGEWEMLPWDFDLSFGLTGGPVKPTGMTASTPNNGLFVGGSFPGRRSLVRQFPPPARCISGASAPSRINSSKPTAPPPPN
ncbi:MAG: CotH kinase family protein [Verrucomicrobia bacterium]|nr:CotH kinase family protein [Verrucomicrobiota bacterium]